MSSPLKHAHCEATQHSLATGRVVRIWGGKKKKRVNEIEEGGNPCYPRLQLGDVDHSAPHKVHKHTGFNVSVNALQIPSLPSCAAHSPAGFSSLRDAQNVDENKKRINRSRANTMTFLCCTNC